VKKIVYLILMIALVCMLATMVFAQPGPIGPSSEWEATGFNNGRHIVRDSNGYFHAFFHSQANPANPPSGTGCDIYYTYTRVPANEPPSMALQGLWAPPINMTAALRNRDNRYASVDIEYEVYDFAWQNTNMLHVVWQAILGGGTRYEVLYARIPVANPPVPPAPWAAATNLSMSATDSLVPAIAINRYGPNVLNQHLHVVWQEEDVNAGGQPLPQEDNWYSEIYYRRSVNSGLAWGNIVNLTNSPRNSQMPSISCALDQNSGTPGPSPHRFGVNDFGYNSSSVHVTYNEDVPAVPGNINVYYLKSPNDGVNWNPPINVSVNTGNYPQDAYSNIAVDMLDNPHIVFMRKGLTQREPRRAAAPTYLPGINPSLWRSFPGPEVGMYNVMPSCTAYAYLVGGVWQWRMWGGNDQEFPTVSLDRWMHVNVNWQEYLTTGDYEIMRDTRINMTPPQWPLVLQVYGLWTGIMNDSNDPANDDLFPNLAHHKVAMYRACMPGPAPNEPVLAGFDEIWTKVTGHGVPAAIAPNPKIITQDGNMQWGP
jgi:hypothetical protein